MKIRLITGAIGVALCVSALPAEARRPASEVNHSGAYGGGARMLDFDHHQFWSSRQASRGTDSDDQDARREITPRRRRRREPRGPARALRAASPPLPPSPSPRPSPPAPSPCGPADAGGGGARGCLSAPARALLERIESQFGAMQVISTCRPGARIAGTGQISRHASGNAIDFNAGGRKGEVVRWLIANHKAGGVMTYAGMSHVHVDIGYHFVALNSGGRRR